MKKTFKYSLTLVTLLAFLFTISMAPNSVNSAYDIAGSWTYEIETPDGAISGTMEIEKSDDGYAVTVQTDDFGDLELEDVEFDAKEADSGVLTGNVDVQGISAEFELEFSEDSAEGEINYGGEGLYITAERDK